MDVYRGKHLGKLRYSMESLISNIDSWCFAEERLGPFDRRTNRDLLILSAFNT